MIDGAKKAVTPVTLSRHSKTKKIIFYYILSSNYETEFALRAGKIIALPRQKNFPRQGAKMKSYRQC